MHLNVTNTEAYAENMQHELDINTQLFKVGGLTFSNTFVCTLQCLLTMGWE